MSKDNLSRVKMKLARNPKLDADTIMRDLKVSKSNAYNLLSRARSALNFVKQPDGTWKMKERMQSSRPEGMTAAQEKEIVADVAQEIAKQTALNVQVGGDHYKNMAIQPVEFCEKNKLSHLESSIVKRVCRWRNKDGLKDLLKIKHEVDLLIELNNLK
jgi:hypothetical protein